MKRQDIINELAIIQARMRNDAFVIRGIIKALQKEEELNKNDIKT
jgi:hypothetical protein